jgi:hypothetical protein
MYTYTNSPKWDQFILFTAFLETALRNNEWDFKVSGDILAITQLCRHLINNIHRYPEFEINMDDSLRLASYSPLCRCVSDLNPDYTTVKSSAADYKMANVDYRTDNEYLGTLYKDTVDVVRIELIPGEISSMLFMGKFDRTTFWPNTQAIIIDGWVRTWAAQELCNINALLKMSFPLPVLNRTQRLTRTLDLFAKSSELGKKFAPYFRECFHTDGVLSESIIPYIGVSYFLSKIQIVTKLWIADRWNYFGVGDNVQFNPQGKRVDYDVGAFKFHTVPDLPTGPIYYDYDRLVKLWQDDELYDLSTSSFNASDPIWFKHPVPINHQQLTSDPKSAFDSVAITFGGENIVQVHPVTAYYRWADDLTRMSDLSFIRLPLWSTSDIDFVRFPPSEIPTLISSLDVRKNIKVFDIKELERVTRSPINSNNI